MAKYFPEIYKNKGKINEGKTLKRVENETCQHLWDLLLKNKLGKEDILVLVC